MLISNGISLIPIQHGKVLITQYVKEQCINNHYDCIAVDLPNSLESEINNAVDKLPHIAAVVAKKFDNHNESFYIPIDPCDATIEGIRQAQQQRIKPHFIGYPKLTKYVPLPPLPDEFAIKKIGFNSYTALCSLILKKSSQKSNNDIEAQYIANQLLTLKKEYSSILAIVHIRYFKSIIKHLYKEESYNLTFNQRYEYDTITEYINPNHLYFALGELPFVTGKFEKEKYDILGTPLNIIDTIKDIFIETRNNYSNDKNNYTKLSPNRIKIALQYLRNLTVIKSRFVPDLFDIITAAKGIGGNSFALNILENAKYYPYLNFDNNKFINIGINKIKLSNSSEYINSINLFKDTVSYWKQIKIKHPPTKLKKKDYKFKWNPYNSYSHIPEDKTIERFNSHIRTKTKMIISESFAKTEEFLSSVKDGIDIRETLRNIHTDKIYVKETPVSVGNVDTVIIIFDENNDAKYTQRVTWYAEHAEESTLSFYATDALSNIIGPGIAKCMYGGLSLLYPPRIIPNIWDNPSPVRFKKLSHKLTYEAMKYSQEKSIAYISKNKPSIILKQLANNFSKNLVWIPISHFSLETLQKLKYFHILNNKNVRSWAGRFIGE